MMADDTGVVNIPLDLVEDVLGALKGLLEKEEAVTRAVKAGAKMSELRSILAPEKW